MRAPAPMVVAPAATSLYRRRNQGRRISRPRGGVGHGPGAASLARTSIPRRRLASRHRLPPWRRLELGRLQAPPRLPPQRASRSGCLELRGEERRPDLARRILARPRPLLPPPSPGPLRGLGSPGAGACCSGGQGRATRRHVALSSSSLGPLFPPSLPPLSCLPSLSPACSGPRRAARRPSGGSPARFGPSMDAELLPAAGSAAALLDSAPAWTRSAGTPSTSARHSSPSTQRRRTGSLVVPVVQKGIRSTGTQSSSLKDDKRRRLPPTDEAMEVSDSLEKGTEHEDEYMISEKELLFNWFISVPKHMGAFNCGAFVAGIEKKHKNTVINDLEYNVTILSSSEPNIESAITQRRRI